MALLNLQRCKELWTWMQWIWTHLSCKTDCLVNIFVISMQITSTHRCNCNSSLTQITFQCVRELISFCPPNTRIISNILHIFLQEKNCCLEQADSHPTVEGYDSSGQKQRLEIQIRSSAYIYLKDFSLASSARRHGSIQLKNKEEWCLHLQELHRKALKHWAIVFLPTVFFFFSFFSSACEFRFIERIGTPCKQNPDFIIIIIIIT